MQTVRCRLKCWALIAIFAVLGMAVLPSASRLLMAVSGSKWVEICTTTGTRWVQLNSDAPMDSADPLNVQMMPDCPACCHLSHGAGLPPSIAQPPVFIGAEYVIPVLFLLGPRTQFAWAAAQPRGPPTRG
jgi:hypothetical protein